MIAVTFQGYKNVRVKSVPDPTIEHPDDAIVRVLSTSICGSDLQLMHGLLRSPPVGSVMGHEAMGIVEEVGPAVKSVRKGDKLVIPCNFSCTTDLHSNSERVSFEQVGAGHGPGVYFGGYGCAGGHSGGQAEFMRIPHANRVPCVIPRDCELDDDLLLLLSDVLPSAYWGVENSSIKAGDTVLVLGCGPLGLLVQKFAWIMGARRVIAVDYLDYRLAHARIQNNVEIINFTQVEDFEGVVQELTKGGADVVIDCVGMDGKKTTLEKVRVAMKRQDGSLSPLRMASQSVKHGGTVQLVGVYGPRTGTFPLVKFTLRNVTLRMGMVPFTRYIHKVMGMLEDGSVHVRDLITHRLPLSDARHAYEIFDNKMDNCIKLILKP